MSDLDPKAIRESHVPIIQKNHPMLPGPETSNVCVRCKTEWPCIVIRLTDLVEDAYAKMNMLGQYVETENGIFSFPDGDYVETKKAEQ